MKKVIEQLNQLADMHKALTGEPVSAGITAKTKDYEKGLFNIVVLGEVKKGKSSFINALLGVENLVPVDTGIATSCVYRIKYGEQLSYTVHFFCSPEADTPARAPQTIEANEVAAYGTEKGNPMNEKEVDYIEITCPSEFLRSGFCIVDTPGLGGMYKAHRAITYRYVSQADAVFFVTDHKAPIGHLECGYIKDVLEVTPHLYFVQTKTFNDNAINIKRRKENNLAIIHEHCPEYGKDCHYFLLDCQDVFNPDADEDDMEDSGYPAIRAFCHDVLLTTKNKMSTMQLTRIWTPVLLRCRAALETQTTLLNTEEKDKLAELKREAETAMNEFAEWKQNIRSNYLAPLKKLVDAAYQHALHQCSGIGLGGELHTALCAIINASQNLNALNKLLDGDTGDLPLKDRMMQDIRREFQRIIAGYVNTISEGITKLTNAVTGAHITDKDCNISANRVNNILGSLDNGIQGINVYDRVRSGTMGVGVGATIGGFVGSIAGSVIPGVGNAIGGYLGSAIGAWFGGVQGNKGMVEQHLARQKQILTSSVDRALSVAGQEITRTVTSLHSRVADESRECVEDFLAQEEASLAQASQQLKARAGLSSDELNKAKLVLATQKRTFNTILATFNQVPAQPA